MMDPLIRHLKPEEIVVEASTIAKLISIDPDNISEPYNGIIAEEISQIPSYQNIRGGYRILDNFKVDLEKNTISIDDIEFNAGKEVTRYLKKGEQIGLFTCTAGSEVSLRSKELMNDGNLLEGYICDVIGSVIVEEAMDLIHQQLIKELENKGLNSSNRYSPGYCNWNVSEQKKLFSFFPEGFCGITLSESSLMNPIKSVSGIFVIGKDVKFHKYICNACSSVNCIYRNHKYK